MTKHVTGEHFVIRTNGTYVNPASGVVPTRHDLGTYFGMPAPDILEDARREFIDLREREATVGISLGALHVDHEIRHTSRILGIVPLSRWQVVETFPVPTGPLENN